MISTRSVAAVALVALCAALTAAAPTVGQAVLWTTVGLLVVALGLVAGVGGRRYLVLAALPATLLTESALVPPEGRYVPAVVTLGALLISCFNDPRRLIAAARSLPLALAATIGAYLVWGLVTTVTSSEPGLSTIYLVGLVLSLTSALLIIPIEVHRPGILRQLVVVLAMLGLALVLSGLALAAIGGIDLFHRRVGLYFIEELVLFGSSTGIVFPQDYGPFVGPATEALAFAIPAALYLASTSTAGRRISWIAAAVVIAAGLFTTFSREGILMAAIGVGGLAVYELRQRRLGVATALMAAVLSVLFIGSMTGAVGVLGRLDLTASWYGKSGVAILLNPDYTQRGEEQAPGPSSAPGASSIPGAGGTSGGSQGGSAGGSGSYPGVIDLKTASSFDTRFSLWEASARAAAARPLLGFGLGTDADAIAPYLVGEDARLRGVTSHSTFFRVAVEMGLPGLLIQLVISAIAVLLSLRALWIGRSDVAAVLGACLLATVAHEVGGTLLFGGLSYANFFMAMAVGILAVPLWRDRRRSAFTDPTGTGQL